MLNNKFCWQELAQEPAPTPVTIDMSQMTPLEQQVLVYHLHGFTVRETADALGIGTTAVSTHRRKALTTNVLHGMSDLVRASVGMGFTTLPTGTELEKLTTYFEELSPGQRKTLAQVARGELEGMNQNSLPTQLNRINGKMHTKDTAESIRAWLALKQKADLKASESALDGQQTLAATHPTLSNEALREWIANECRDMENEFGQEISEIAHKPNAVETEIDKVNALDKPAPLVSDGKPNSADTQPEEPPEESSAISCAYTNGHAFVPVGQNTNRSQFAHAANRTIRSGWGVTESFEERELLPPVAPLISKNESAEVAEALPKRTDLIFRALKVSARLSPQETKLRNDWAARVSETKTPGYLKQQ